MLEIYARRIKATGRLQLLEDHLRNVSILAQRFGDKLCSPLIPQAAGVTHDYGKLPQEFQDYLFDDNAKRGEVRHSIHGAARLYNETLAFPPVAELFANIIMAHHGRLYDFISPDGETPLFDSIEAHNSEQPPSASIAVLEKNAGLDLSELRDEFLTTWNNMREEERAFGLSMLVKLYYSMLVDADRLDAYLFESGQKYAEVKPDWDAMLSALSKRLAEFKTDSEMAALRKTVSDGCAEAGLRGKGIYKLQVPTGGGKTLASLRFALIHAKKHGMDKIIYVIPYLSILSQTAQEIRRALNADEFTVLEHHSGFLPDEDENYKLHTDRWDAPVILTTQVQFLESVFSANGSDLRKLHNMANAVFIFDEAQSVPIKCTYLFNGAVNFLNRTCGSTILLCTATQPPFEDIPHRMWFSDNASLVPCGKEPKRTEIINAMIPGGYSYTQLAEFVLDKHSSSTLVIVNTKAAAKSLYQELKKAGAPVLHLSTSMCSAHRDAVINELRRRIDRKVNEPVICVSTQLIEAGVDISLECVIRDVAGWDSVIQAAGRCNRHGEYGGVKPVYVVNITDENLDKLPDIKKGAEITRDLYHYRTPDINEYYRKFFFERQSEMSYPVKNGTLYDWLTVNCAGTHAYANRTDIKGKRVPVMHAAIRSAADEFFVIDRGHTDVVVPYGEGPSLLDQYLKTWDYAEKRRLLQQLGKYGVSLYQYQFNALEDRGALHNREGVWELAGGFYDAERGVDLDGQLEFLNA
jgi:CRISPR-associated endonuclease/helicase Cas3